MLCVTFYDNQCKSSTAYHAELGISIQHAILRTKVGGTDGDENWFGWKLQKVGKIDRLTKSHLVLKPSLSLSNDYCLLRIKIANTNSTA